MHLKSVRFLLALVLVTGPAAAQFTEPKTPAEFFNRMKFEMDVGNYSTAAKFLDALLKLPPSEKDLVELEKAEGTTAFLKLRNIPRWADPVPPGASEETRKAAAAFDAAARKNVETLLLGDADKRFTGVLEAVRKHLSDPERIKKFVRNLTVGKDEYEYAMGELYRSGIQSIPYILDELRVADGEQRVALLKALTQFGPEVTPALIAGLDSGVPILQLDLVGVLRQRGDTVATPALFWILGNTASPLPLKAAARDALAYFLRLPADRLPAPRAALTEEAERYYRHKVAFADPRAVTVWRWDNDRVTQGWKDKRTIPATKAEEYYATRYATQALALDPAYVPAQVLLASLMLDKNYEEIGPAKSLAEVRPGVYQMLAAASPEVLTLVLERGLRDKRRNVILGALRILGTQGEVRGNTPRDLAQPVLAQALNYPEPRVQLTAVETQLKMPGRVSPANAVRVVDILRRALAGDALTKPTARVLVGYFNENLSTHVAAQLRQIGLEPVVVRSGRAGIRRLQEASDIDAILMDADLPDPGLQNVLAQLKTDRNARALPVVLTAEPRSFERWRFYLEKNAQAQLLPVAATDDLLVLKNAIQGALGAPEQRPLTPEEVQNHAERAIKALAKLARKELPGYDVRPAEVAVFDVLRTNKLSVEGQVAAVQVIATLPGSRPQPELLEALVRAAHPNPVRIAAAEGLVKNLQQFGLILRPAQTAVIAPLAADPKLDPALKSAVTALLGALNPTLRLSGERLQGYQPEIVPPPLPMPMPMPPKDK